MRATTQLAAQLNIPAGGYLANSDYRALILGDLYADDKGDTIPCDYQIINAADRLIAWWNGLLTTDNLSMAAAFKSNMDHYRYVAQSILSQANRTVNFSMTTQVFMPRFLRIKIWNTEQPTSALYLVLPYPDDATVQSLKTSGKIWKSDWTNMLTFKSMYAISYNGVIVYRNNNVWTMLDHGTIPDTAG